MEMPVSRPWCCLLSSLLYFLLGAGVGAGRLVTLGVQADICSLLTAVDLTTCCAVSVPFYRDPVVLGVKHGRGSCVYIVGDLSIH